MLNPTRLQRLDFQGGDSIHPLLINYLTKPSLILDLCHLSYKEEDQAMPWYSLAMRLSVAIADRRDCIPQKMPPKMPFASILKLKNPGMTRQTG